MELGTPSSVRVGLRVYPHDEEAWASHLTHRFRLQ